MEAFFGNKLTSDHHFIRHILINYTGDNSGKNVTNEDGDKGVPHVESLFVVWGNPADIFRDFRGSGHFSQREDQYRHKREQHVLRE